MHIRELNNTEEIIAGDATVLHELFHGPKDGLAFQYSLAHATREPGTASKPHRLKTSEVYYILRGKGMMHINEESAAVHAGQAIDIPPGSLQWIENIGTEMLEFLCIVDPAWKQADEEILS